MPTIRGENGKQVRVTMGDILRGTRKIKVEKAEVAARKRAKSLDKSLDNAIAPKPTPPQREVKVVSPKTAPKNSKAAPKKVEKAAPTDAPTASRATRSASKSEPKGLPDVSEWTADQEARLKRLKKADAGWKAISTLMGKSIDDLKTHWAELQFEDNQNNSAPGANSTDFPGWNPELDAHLRGLKEANTPWKLIASELGKTVNEVKARWAVLAVMPREEPTGDGPVGKDEVQLSRQNKRQVSFASPLIATETGKAQNSKPRNSKPILFVDEDFNVDDIVVLNRIASRYEEEKWLRITSRFFDKTGKRITLEQAKSRVSAASE